MKDGSRPNITWRLRVVALGGAAGAVYLLLIGGTPLGMAIPELRVVSLLLATIWLGGWILAAWKDPAWRPRSVFLPAIVAAIVSLAISVAFSRSPRISGEALAQSVLFASGYLLLVELLRRPNIRKQLVFAAAVVGVVLSAAYIELIGLEWALFWQLVGRIATPPLRPDFASLVYWNPAPVLALAVLLSTSLVATVPPTRRGAVTAGICVSLAMATALLTGTRAGWIAIAGALVIVALIAAARGTTRSTLSSLARWVAGSRKRLVVTGVGAGLGVALMVTLAPGVLRRLAAGGEEVRSSFFVAAYRMFERSPATGLGPGMWAMDRAAYTTPNEVDEFVVDAHNVYLQNLAATGLLGAVAFVIAFATLIWLVRQGLRDDRADRRRWAWAACVACSYMALHQLLVSFLNVPAVLLAAVIPVAMLDASSDRPSPFNEAMRLRSNRASRVGWSIGTATLVLALLFAWWTIPATTLASNVARAVDSGDWAEADALARQARTLDPSFEQYAFLSGLSAAHLGDNARAASDFASFAAFTDLPEAWVNLAQLRIDAGDVAGATDALHRASRLGLQHPAVAIAVVDLAVRAGDVEMAIRAGAEAIARAPSLAGDPWWNQDSYRAAIFPDVLAAALELGVPQRHWEILLMAGRPAEASSAGAAALDRPLTQAVIEAWRGDATAVQHLYELCDADPLEGPIAWCARVASHRGDATTARRYRRLATMLHIDPNTTHELRIMPVLTRQSVAGDVAYKASGLSERNLSLWDILIPGIPRIDLAG